MFQSRSRFRHVTYAVREQSRLKNTTALKYAARTPSMVRRRLPPDRRLQGGTIGQVYLVAVLVNRSSA